MGREYQGGSHVFNVGELIAPEIKLSFVEWVGKLWRLLDEFGCDSHSIIKLFNTIMIAIDFMLIIN